jgi:plastocyanin
MKKILSVVIIVVLVVAGGVIVLTRKHTPSNNMSNMSNMGSNSNSTAVATDKVSISNFSFSPSSITVKKGTTVTWTNHDSIAHTVVETDGKTGPNSQNIDNGKTYSFTYNTVGAFAYHCSIHPEMTGTVTVTE